MEVYIEWTYMFNGLIILWSLEILHFLLNQMVSMKKLMLYVLLYNISFFLLYVDVFNGFILLYDLLISLLLFKKLAYIYYPLYVFIYVSIVSFMHFMIKNSVIYQGVLLLQGLSMPAMFLITIIIIIFVYFYVYYCKNKIHSHYVEVELNHQHCLGFIDNGNQVSYKGSPVIFMNEAFVPKEYLDTIVINVVNHQQEIRIVQVKDIRIDKHVLHDVYIGVMDHCEYDCILNHQLLGGLL